MRRIGLAVILTVGLTLAPHAGDAQPPGKVYRIGYLGTNPPPAHQWDALLDGLRERGYIEGRNIVFERRFSEGKAERFPEFAAEMVRLRVDIIMVPTTPAAIATKNATQTIPIVILTAIDPVGAGLVASLARPGGNITGLSVLAPELSRGPFVESCPSGCGCLQERGRECRPEAGRNIAARRGPWPQRIRGRVRCNGAAAC